MDKQQEQTQKESSIYEMWEKDGYFKADPDSIKPSYSLLMPPPNLTGALHMGHAMQHAILDALARYKRMKGFDVLLQPGVDHAGIQFESTLDKKLAKEGLSKRKLGRDEWMKKAWEFKDENYNAFHNTWKLIGVSADWDREVFTFEDRIQRAVSEEFKKFWDEGLIYKGAYIVQWCSKDGTAIEDIEMEYEERKEKLFYVKYAIKDEPGEFISVATARPETIFADSGIAVHPNHPTFKQYIGKLAINPLNEELLPIFEDDRVDKDFGTGALKITPGHDPLDYEIGKDHRLPIYHAVDKTGKMTAKTFITNAEESLEGLSISDARKRTEEVLQERGAIDKIEDYTHSVPVCERCKTTVEPLVSEEWFIKMDGLAKKAIKHIGEVNFAPSNYQKILTDWLEKMHDWSISRSLWWGHRIPVWYCEECNPEHRTTKGSGVMISFEKPEGKCAPDPKQSEEVTKACQNCTRCNWVQDEQVLDTWFSSGMWPMITLGWPEKTKEFNKYFPWDFELTSPEIRYLWIARMIMLSLHFEDSIPFKNMFFHGMLRDTQGRKFSKSLGNGIDPEDLRSQWGTDAMRMTLYSYSAPGRDAKVNRQIMDERCKNFRNFSTKLHNMARFIFELKPVEVMTTTDWSYPEDMAIKQKLDAMIAQVEKNIDEFNLHLAVDEIYAFVWHEFADVYIESSKKRRAEAQPVLEYLFTNCLKLLHPFMPFTTEEIWQNLAMPEPLIISLWPTTI